MSTFYPENDYRSYLAHYGVKGMKWRRHKVTGNQDPRSKYSSNRFMPRPWDPNYKEVQENNRSNWENNGTRNRGIEWHRSTRGYDRHHIAVEIANNVSNKKRPGEGINAPKPTERYDRSVHVSGTGSSRTRRRRRPSRRSSSSSRG